MKKLFGLILLGLVSFSYADHSLNTVVDGRTNLTKAIEAAAKARGTPFCDLSNSIQIPVPSAADPTSTWRQVAFCYKTQEKLESAQEQLKQGGSTIWQEKGKEVELNALYGLPVDSVIEVTYEMEWIRVNQTEAQKPIAKKLISLTVQ